VNDTPTIPSADQRFLDGLRSETTRTVGEHRFLGFRILRRIGGGGFGDVFLCEEVALDRKVAIKRLRLDRLPAANAREWLEREGKRQARLKHPNIVSVLGVSRPEEEPFLVFEYVEGPTLRQWLADLQQQGQIPDPRTVAAVVRALASAAGHAHEQGVVHSDIKPGNVLLRTEHGRLSEPLVPLLTDFGLARLTDPTSAGDDWLTGGTPLYMAPEQGNGDPSPPQDIWALGVVLYELLTGRLPFEGQHLADIREQIQNIPANLLSRRHPGLPRDLAAIGDRCLHKDPQQRYQTGQELAEDLDRYLNGEPVQARPVGTLERGLKWVRRHVVISALVAGLVLVLLAGVIVSALFARSASLEALAARKAEGEAEGRATAEAEAKKVAQERLWRAQWLVYIGHLNQAQSALTEGNLGLAVHHLEECQWNLRGWEHDHLWTRVHASKLTLRGHLYDISSVVFSPDGKRIATCGWDQTARVWDAESGKQLLIYYGHETPVLSVCFSPDGKRIVSGSWDGTARVWDAATGQEILILRGHRHFVNSASFSPDGKRILTGSMDRTARVWSAETGKVVLTIKGHADPVYSAAWSPDGKQIVTGSYDRTARLWDASTGQELRVLKGHTDRVCSVCYSPDGKQILTGSGEFDGTARLWDAATGKEILALKKQADWITSVCFSPDGTRILTGCGLVHARNTPSEAKVWDARTGQEILSLKGHTNWVTSVAWSLDGKRILTGGGEFGKPGEAKVWDADRGQETLTLKDPATILSVCFSPDGKRILAGNAESLAKVCDAGTGQELLTLRGHTAWVASVCYSPDGKRILTGSGDNTARVWDAETGQELLTLRGRDGHTNRVTGACYSPDGTRIVTASHDKTARVWDAVTGKEIFRFQGHGNLVTCVAFRPDGQRIVSGSADSTAKVWDARTGRELLTIQCPESVLSVCFSNDGKRIVTSADQTAKVWDADNGQLLLTLRGHTAPVHNVRFSPDDKRIVTGSVDHMAKVWDAVTGYELLSLKGHVTWVISVGWSRDGKRILTGGGKYGQPGEVKVWDAGKGSEVLSLKGHTHAVACVAYSADGKRMLTGSEDTTAKLWDAQTGQELFTFQGHTSGVAAVGFTPDGERVFTQDRIGRVRAWSSTDGKPVEARDPPQLQTGAARSPDGFLHALPEPDALRVTIRDLRRPPIVHTWPLPDAAERKRYHSERAALAEQERQWFAVAFHLGRLLLDDPDNADLKQRREQALQKHAQP
jgi:WD40 repeat protein/tRNA A-37 threonylcarbamoyl transferase component Bud32